LFPTCNVGQRSRKFRHLGHPTRSSWNGTASV
jgi:hypothetical protein